MNELPKQELIVYFKINNYQGSFDILSDTPENAIVIVQDLLSGITQKVENIKIADKATGYLLRGFDK